VFVGLAQNKARKEFKTKFYKQINTLKLGGKKNLPKNWN